MDRVIGCSKETDGSMHIFNVENKFDVDHGIVGAQVPIGKNISVLIIFVLRV